MRSTSIVLFALVVLGVACLAPAALADPGSLDPLFGADGIAYIDLGGPTSVLQTAITADGSVLALCSDGTGSFMVRLTAGGQPDPEFGIDGRAPVGSTAHIWVQPAGGRIIVGGEAFTVAGDPDPSYGDGAHPAAGEVGAMAGDGSVVWVGADSVTRLTPDGAPDPSFGTSGSRPLAISPTWPLSPKAVVIDDQGRIVVSGIIAFDAFVLRLLPDGSLDTTFSGDGWVVDRWWQNIRDLLPAPGGGVYAIWTDDHTPVHDEFEVNRVTLTSTGVITQTIFGAPGVSSYTLLPDGGAIVGGSLDSGFPSYLDVVVRRFTPLGLPDETFAPGGKVTLDFGSWNDTASIIARPDGRILIAGATQQSLPGTPSRTSFGALGVRTETMAQRGMVAQLSGGRRTGLATRLTRTPTTTPVTLRLRSGKATWKTTGWLKCAGTPVGGVKLTVQRSRDGRTWSSITYGKTGVYGSVAKSVTFTRRGTYYVRWKFAGTTSYLPATSKVTKIVVK